jgi:hypothetical protein
MQISAGFEYRYLIHHFSRVAFWDQEWSKSNMMLSVTDYTGTELTECLGNTIKRTNFGDLFGYLWID